MACESLPLGAPRKEHHVGACWSRAAQQSLIGMGNRVDSILQLRTPEGLNARFLNMQEAQICLGQLIHTPHTGAARKSDGIDVVPHTIGAEAMLLGTCPPKP